MIVKDPDYAHYPECKPELKSKVEMDQKGRDVIHKAAEEVNNIICTIFLQVEVHDKLIENFLTMSAKAVDRVPTCLIGSPGQHRQVSR